MTQAGRRNLPGQAQVWVMLPMIAFLTLVSGFFQLSIRRNVGSSTRGAVGGGGPSAAERDREDLMNDFMRLKESSLVGQEVPTSTNDKVSYHFFVCLEGEM